MGTVDGRLDLPATADVASIVDTSPMPDAAVVDSSLPEVATDTSALPDTAPTETAPGETSPPETGPPDRAPEDAVEAGDTADALPPGATATLRSVLVGAGGTTAKYGGSGGSLFTDDCGTAGEVVVGYAGYKETYFNSNNEYVIALQVMCGRMEIAAGATVARMASMRTLARRGDSRGTTWQAQCPQDQAIVGYTALLDAGEQTENLLFHCAPLQVAASPPGTVTPGPITMLSWVGRLAAGPLTNTSCPAGQVGRGQVVRVGSWIDAFHVTCGVLSAGP